jgi:hypothetical protein
VADFFSSEASPYKMKTLHFALLTACVVAAAAKLHGQGTIFLNNYDSGLGIFANASGLFPASTGTRVEVLAGPTPNSLTPIINGSLLTNDT